MLSKIEIKPNCQTIKRQENECQTKTEQEKNTCATANKPPFLTESKDYKTLVSVFKQAHPGKTCQPGNESCGWVHSSWCGSEAGCTVALHRWPAPSAGTCERGVKGPAAVGSICASLGLPLEVPRWNRPPQYRDQPDPHLLLLPMRHHLARWLPQVVAPAAVRPWEIEHLAKASPGVASGSSA